MTAPLRHNIQAQHKISLRTTVYQLLDAIDTNQTLKVEMLLCEILKEDVPEVSLQLFYNYAQKGANQEVCDYIQSVLSVMDNRTPSLFIAFH